MTNRPRRMMRFLAGHLAVGTAAAAVFVGALLATDALGLASLVRADADGWVAVALLGVGVWVTFGSLAMGAGIMYVEKDRESGGDGLRLGLRPALVPVRPRSGSRSSR